MRILMLTQFYPPIIGGEERHVRDLSIELAARGHDVAVATLWQEGIPEFECVDGVRIYRVRGSLQRVSAVFHEKERQHAPPFPDPEVLLALRRIIMNEHPDVVHAHNWLVHSFTPLKTWSKAKLVVTLHDYGLVCAKQGFVHRKKPCDGTGLTKCLQCASEHYGVARGVPITLATWISRKIEYQAVDMFLPVSQSVAEETQLAKHGVEYQVIPNFIPNSLNTLSVDIDALLEQLPRDDYLLFVGDVGYGKGVGILLQAYAQMKMQIPLVLIGRPVADFSVNLPPNVRILQSWPHAAVMSAWSRCTVGLMPSFWPDACPTVAMEAMAMGRPVVASCMGGLSEIVVNGETGFLVTPGDVTALREAIEHLLYDKSLREQMGTKARQRVTAFQANTVIPRIEHVYQQLLQA